MFENAPDVAAHPPAPLRVYRVAGGETQAQLAVRAQVSERTVVRLERGEVPSLQVAQALADALTEGSLDALFPSINDECRRPDGDA